MKKIIIIDEETYNELKKLVKILRFKSKKMVKNKDVIRKSLELLKRELKKADDEIKLS